jgi:hypothetical protein
VLRALGAAGGLAAGRKLLPVPLACGEAGGAAFLLTSKLPGADGRRVPVPLAAALTVAAAGAIAPLHRLGQATAEVTEASLAAWVDAPAAGRGPGGRGHPRGAGRGLAAAWLDPRRLPPGQRAGDPGRRDQRHRGLGPGPRA